MTFSALRVDKNKAYLLNSRSRSWAVTWVVSDKKNERLVVNIIHNLLFEFLLRLPSLKKQNMFSPEQLPNYMKITPTK